MGASYLDEARLPRSIAAIATARGSGAIGIVRISGSDAIDVGARVFSRPDRLRSAASHTMHLGSVIASTGDRVDNVLAAVMRAPGTYTGEDSVEFNAHGGNVQLEAVLRACLEAGALPALPGEFTFRAFYNGKIDLTQAESVADLIESTTDAASRAALIRSEGVLRARLEQIRDSLVGLMARLEASIDFVDEGIPEPEHEHVIERLSDIESDVTALTESFAYGRMLREGARVVLVGAPNAGKSSLFNALVRSERAIVTSVPGTTRDAVTELVDIGGIPVIVADTAGLRETADEVELEGLKFTQRYLGTADLTIEVIDISGGQQDMAYRLPQGDRLLRVMNKVDLVDSDLAHKVAAAHPGAVLVSAMTCEGLDELTSAIASALAGNRLAASEVCISRSRQHEALVACNASLAAARRNMESHEPLEVIALDLRSAGNALDELLGRVLNDEVLERIFGQFCIGK